MALGNSRNAVRTCWRAPNVPDAVLFHAQYNRDFIPHSHDAATILIVTDGVVDIGGGGSGQIIGSVFVAKIWGDHVTDRALLPSLGAPSASWNGGGNNGILYDHCFADKLLSLVPFDPPPSVNPLKVLSFRMLPY